MKKPSSVRRSILCLATIVLATATASCAGASGGTGSGDPPERIGSVSSAVDTLTAVTTFGTNPGSLQMFTYAPSGIGSKAPVVLALHGCTQTASEYEEVGWNALADKYGFYLVYPQQQSANNSESCFNWFGNTSGSTADITRGQGEAESINEMVDYMKTTYSVDSSRIYVTGFSAGAAYAVALLAMYPDVFAAGASFSGVPFGCATSLSSAYTCMYSSSSNTAAQWGTLVKAAYPGYSGPYPRLSVWQGSQDTTVATANLGEIVSEWTNVTGVSGTATSTDTVSSFPHSSYADSNGVVQVESYSITGMAHAVAIDVSNGCGTADTYSVDEKICAVDLVAKFFGLEGAVVTGSSSGSGASSSSGSGGSSGTTSGGGTSGGGTSGGSGNGSSGATASSSGGTSPASSGAGAASSGGASTDTTPASLPGCSAAPGTRPGTGIALVTLAFGIALLGRRRVRGMRGAAAASVFLGLVLSAGAAQAKGEQSDIELDPVDGPKAEAQKTPDTSLAKPAILGPQGAFFTGAAVSATPAWLLGYFPVDHLATTVGLGFTYNGNGAPSSPLTSVKGAPNNHVGSDLFLDVLYFVHDRAPFAMGPELNVITSLSPNYPATVIIVTPLLALRYSPWKAPIAIGTGLGMSFAFTRGAQPVASLATQGLDIVYAF